jgi:peptide/nickel transport system ATP-binding protein
MVESLLSVRNLKTHLFTRKGILKAVDDVSIEIRNEEIIGLVGESGCGKSMTALSIIKLIPNPPAKIVGGEAIFNNRDLLEVSEKELEGIRGKHIAMVFQDPMSFLNPVMRVKDQISEGMLLHHIVSNKKEALARTFELLDAVRIPSPEDVAYYYPHQLSGGMRQRVLIAMAWSCSPELLIADEITSALDVTVQAQIMALIKELVRKTKVSYLFITHDLGLVADICDRIYVMYAGKIVENGDVFACYEAPMHPYTIGLLNSVLSIDGHMQNLVGIGGNVPDLINPPLGCRFSPRCKQAKDICRKKEPSLTKVGSEHFVSCWLDV